MNATPKWVIFALMALGVSSIVGWIEVLDQHRQVDQLRQSADKRTLALDKIIGKWADIQNVDNTLTIAESRDRLVKRDDATGVEIRGLAERIRKLEAVNPSGGNVDNLGEIESRMGDRFANVSRRIDAIDRENVGLKTGLGKLATRLDELEQREPGGCGCVLVPIDPEPMPEPQPAPPQPKPKPAPKRPKRCP